MGVGCLLYYQCLDGIFPYNLEGNANIIRASFVDLGDGRMCKYGYGLYISTFNIYRVPFDGHDSGSTSSSEAAYDVPNSGSSSFSAGSVEDTSVPTDVSNSAVAVKATFVKVDIHIQTFLPLQFHLVSASFI